MILLPLLPALCLLPVASWSHTTPPIPLTTPLTITPSHAHTLTCTHAIHAGWWYKPDFIINELNINSAIARPWHDELLPLAADAPYEVKGYAYSGGGRKVTRVEVSLDGGAKWEQAEVKCYEEPNAHGAADWAGLALWEGKKGGGSVRAAALLLLLPVSAGACSLCLLSSNNYKHTHSRTNNPHTHTTT